MATFADMLGIRLPADSAEDSFSILPRLLAAGDGQQSHTRAITIHQTNRLALAIRSGDWKYLDHRGSGGNDYNRSGAWGMKPFAIPDTVPNAPGQLYNLRNDPAEKTNLYFDRPDVRERLKRRLEEVKVTGRSR